MCPPIVTAPSDNPTVASNRVGREYFPCRNINVDVKHRNKTRGKTDIGEL